MKYTREELLKVFKYRYYFLKTLNGLLIFIAVIGMLICGFYTCADWLGISLKNFYISLGKVTIEFEVYYWGILCFILSIFLSFSRPPKLRKQLSVLKQAIKYLHDSMLYKIPLLEYQKKIIELANTYVTEAEIAIIKEISGKTNEIRPHEKRMFFRRCLIILGISGIAILTATLIFVLGWNIPKTAAVDCLIAYVLVVVEAYYYQVQLRKAGVQMFSNQNKKIILKEHTNSNTRELQKQEFACYKKIIYMKHDRYSNYGLVLNVASSSTNILAILITILDSTNATDFKKLFALEISSVNDIVALVFWCVSAVLFWVDIIFQEKIEPKICELKIWMDLPFSKNNFKFLKTKCEMIISNSSIFSRNALDVGRGVYDFNNDILVKNCFENTDLKIPVDVMFTVEKSFPGRVPRYKLAALIFWLCCFCGMVWGTQKIDMLIPITIVTIIFYDLLLFVNSTWLWHQQKKWIAFEKKMQKYANQLLHYEVKWDFYKQFLIHSIWITLLLCLKIRITNINIPDVVLTTSIVIGVGGGMLGYIYAHTKKEFKITQICKLPWIAVGLGIIGMVESIIQYAIHGSFQSLYHILMLIIVIPVLVGIMTNYYLRLDKFAKDNVCLPWSAMLLITNWCNIFLLLNLSRTTYTEKTKNLLIIDVLYEYSSIIILGILFIGIIKAWMNIKKGKLEKVSQWFPYSIFMWTGIFILLKGMMVFFSFMPIIKECFCIIGVLYAACMWGGTFFLKNKIGIPFNVKHWIFMSFMTTLMLVCMCVAVFRVA